MTVNKLYIVLLFIPFFCFTQKKDVYFLLDKNHPTYIIPYDFKKTLHKIILSNRNEYEQREVKKAEDKKKGTYTGYAELDEAPFVSTMEFTVISRKKIELTVCEFQILNLVDYKWIEKNAWKKIGQQTSDFKDIYFLYKEKDKSYILYKVDMTVSIH